MDVPRRSVRSSAFSLLLVLVVGAVAAPARSQVEAPPRSPSEALDEARRLLKEGVEDPSLLRRVAESGGLFRVRAKLLSAALSLAKRDRVGVEAAIAGLPPDPLGIVGLPAFLRAAAGARVGELVEVSASGVDPLLSRAALLTAARLARGDAERALVRTGFERLPPDATRSPRSAIARALALARVAPRAESQRLLVELATTYPDAVERAADLFEPADAEALRDAVRIAPEPVRLARARAIVARDPDEALALAGSLERTPENRLALAELALGAGRVRDAKKALERPSRLAFSDPPRALHVRALALIAKLRGETVRARHRKRPRRPLPLRGASPAAPRTRAVPLTDEEEFDALLASPLADSDRRPLLLLGLKSALAGGDRADARRLLEELLVLDPSSTAGAEDLFLDAFVLYRRGASARSPGELRDAARLWEEQQARYRDVSVRRRATYWAGKAHLLAGERDQAHALWAGLVSGTSADVYGRWAASALGVPLTPAPPAPEAEPVSLPREAPPASESRELLACGMPGLAEDAAERDGTLDIDFAALLASERGEHRRAAALLKAHYPALGTPEEGAVPLAARRAFYPLGASRVLVAAAQESRVPPALLFGLVRQESLFQPAVRSHAGAVGLLQVMPATGRLLARRAGARGKPDLSDPATNARLGASYLAQLLATFGGDTAAALAGYNAGPGRVARWRREARGLSSDEFLEAIPLSEPRDYVRRVLFYEGAYAALYGIASAPITRPDTVAPLPAGPPPEPAL